MSANNWTDCPKCKRRRDVEAKAAMKKATDSYGKVSAEKYEANMRRALSIQGAELENSLREDYEIGIDSAGGFLVSYRGSCTADGCDFSFSYRHEAVTLPQGEAE
jgi:hypothetical protein